MLAPARTPATIVGKLHLETVKAVAQPDLRARLADLGVEGISNSPDDFAALIKSEIAKWAKVIKEAGDRRALAGRMMPDQSLPRARLDRLCAHCHAIEHVRVHGNSLATSERI